MRIESLSLLISLIALVLSVYFFLSYYSFKTSTLLNYDQDNIYLDNSRTLICDNIDNPSTCRYIISNNNMFKNNNNNLLLHKNTMICDNINDISSCVCLSNKCDYLQKLNHITLVDKPISFNKNNGLQYGARIIPIENNSQFTLSFWINISKIDFNKWRSIFLWKNNKYNYSPAILISPQKWSSCGAKIDIRFNNLYNNNEDEELFGSFNIIDGNHGHCIRDTIYHYFKWFHFVIQGKDNKLRFYINTNLVQEEVLTDNFQLGDSDDDIYIGSNDDFTSEGIAISKMKWFSKPLTLDEIKFLYKDNYI